MMSADTQKPGGLVGMIHTLSSCVAQIERKLAGLIGVAVFLLILANIVCRMLRLPVFWIDELAVYAMIWMAFLAASAALQSAEHISVTLLTDSMSPRLKRVFSVLVDAIMLLFGAALVYFAWVWFAPADLLRAGGDIELFSAQTLNFIYSEPTSALNMPKYIFWLIMPLFSVTVTLHSLANILGYTSARNTSTAEGDA